jgi:charged multivesicular body protein 4A/B
MHLFFGKKKKAPAVGVNDAIWKLNETLESLKKRETYLFKKIEYETSVARENARKDKRVAMFALKKKKIYEAQVEKLAGAQMTITSQIIQLEQASTTRDTLEVLKFGADAMKTIYSGMSVDDVENTMEDIRETSEFGNEIMDAISQPIGFGATLDDDELLAELEDLQQQELDAQLLRTEIPDRKPVIVQPVVQTQVVTQSAQPPPVVYNNNQIDSLPQPPQGDEEELRRLANEMTLQ